MLRLKNMWASNHHDDPNRKPPFSVIPRGGALTRLMNEGRHRDEPHGREYKCKRCDDWLPFDTEFYPARETKNGLILAKVCRVCERIRDGR